jgi:hypothetical protein
MFTNNDISDDVRRLKNEGGWINAWSEVAELVNRHDE